MRHTTIALSLIITLCACNVDDEQQFPRNPGASPTPQDFGQYVPPARDMNTTPILPRVDMNPGESDMQMIPTPDLGMSDMAMASDMAPSIDMSMPMVDMGMGEDMGCTPVPQSDDDACAAVGADCGQVMVQDSCGNTKLATCKVCAGVGEVCSDTNTCECTPSAMCADDNTSCGFIDDGCGAMARCACSGLSCEGGMCAATSLQNPAVSSILFFGKSLSAHHDTIASGVPNARGAGLGTSFRNCGAAFIFMRSSNNTWSSVQSIDPPTPSLNGRFGSSIDVHDGTLIIGEQRADRPNKQDLGAAHIYTKAGATPFVLKQTLEPPASLNAGAQAGAAVALFDNVAAVGVPNANKVLLYTRSTGVWGLAREITPPPVGTVSGFGGALAIRDSMLVVGAPGNSSIPGKAFAYTLSPNAQNVVLEHTMEMPQPTGGDGFGASVDTDGARVIVGAPGAGNGAFTIYEKSAQNTWASMPVTISTSISNGADVGQDVSILGERVAVGAQLQSITGHPAKTGAVLSFVYDVAAKQWRETSVSHPPGLATEDYYGAQVVLNHDSILATATQSRAGRGSIKVVDFPE